MALMAFLITGLVVTLHEDIKKIEASVGYLHRVKRHERERTGKKAKQSPANGFLL
jgi:hypothetical protein